MTATEQTARIDTFVKKHLTEAKSESAITVSDTARSAAKHGFTTCANVKYAAFLEAFRSLPELTAKYAEKYPACQFLPWAAFHAIRKSLKLACDLPEFYAGAVPPEQIPWMDVFELEEEDGASPDDATALLETSAQHAVYLRTVCDPYAREPEFLDIHPAFRLAASQDRFAAPIRTMYRLFREQFLVLAPPEAFTTTDDFIRRFQLALDAATRPTNAPNDPLVVKPCKGGVLVVAAWGDEAAYLNQAVKELGL